MRFSNREDGEAGDERDDPPQCRPMLGALGFYLAASRDVPGQDLCQSTEHAVHGTAPLAGGDDQGGGDPVACRVVDLIGEGTKRVIGPDPGSQAPGERGDWPGDRRQAPSWR